MAGRSGSAYERTFLGIAITVTVVWAVATLVQVAFPGHVVPLGVNAAMGAVATAFFGGAIAAGRKGPNGSRRRLPSGEESIMDKSREKESAGD